MRCLMLVASTFVLAVPAIASANVYDIQLGGMCSHHFLEGNGNARMGNWPGETPVDAWVDQTDNMSTATAQFASVLDTYCTGGNYCYIYTFSNGGAVLSRTLSLYASAWNIGYVANAASNEGGSEIGGTGWIGEVFGGCTIAGHIGPSDHRNGWNHYETHGRIIGQIGGDGWLFPYAQSAVLPGHDDGAVAHHSSGGFVQTWSLDSLCYDGHWTNHQVWWSCEYGSNNHYDMKMQAICDDGGC
jgi:hypothetical protein